MAWRVPVLMAKAEDKIAAPHGSKVINLQRQLTEATRKTLEAVVADVGGGLAETVGVGVTVDLDDRASVVVLLPALTDGRTPEYIAGAIDAENVEAWCDEHEQVHVAISPWFTTKDVDQVVLSITKVVHVLLGIHAGDSSQADEKSSASLWRRMMAAALEIAELQKH